MFKLTADFIWCDRRLVFYHEMTFFELHEKRMKLDIFRIIILIHIIKMMEIM